jgi:predicted phosphohydrolase
MSDFESGLMPSLRNTFGNNFLIRGRHFHYTKALKKLTNLFTGIIANLNNGINNIDTVVIPSFKLAFMFTNKFVNSFKALV